MSDDQELEFYEWLDKEFDFKLLFGCCDYFDAVDEIITKSNLNCHKDIKSIIYSIVSLSKKSIIHAFAERLSVDSLAISKELSFDRFCDIRPTSLNSFKNRVEKNNLKFKVIRLETKLKQLEQENGN